MNLVLDLGNTKAKAASFESNKLIHVERFELTQLNDSLESLLSAHEKSILSTVVNMPEEIAGLFEKYSTLILENSTPIPVENGYLQPDTLGKDRLSNAVGAHSIFPMSPVLVIDFGTCIKYDIVSQSEYLGGSISPGLNMRYRALSEFTDKLPLVGHENIPELIGIDTKSSIQSGVDHGIIQEVNGIIHEYRSQFKDLKVVITGGDHVYFAPMLKSPIFARPNLTLEGLNNILEFNS